MRLVRRREKAMSMSCTTGQLCTATSAARQTPDTPDVALVRSIAASDKHAMRILFARNNVRVFRFVLRLVGDNSVAEDLVSEVFLDVASGRKISGRSQVTTWLLAIARNKALSALRHRSTEELDDEAAAAIEDPEDNPEVTIQNRQKTELLLKCLILFSLTCSSPRPLRFCRALSG
jgi:RNA polymerase sigma-70 factor (ECF subfamily)